MGLTESLFILLIFPYGLRIQSFIEKLSPLVFGVTPHLALYHV